MYISIYIYMYIYMYMYIYIYLSIYIYIYMETGITLDDAIVFCMSGTDAREERRHHTPPQRLLQRSCRAPCATSPGSPDDEVLVLDGGV